MTTKEIKKKKEESNKHDSDVKKDLIEMKLTLAIMNKQIEELSKILNINTKPNYSDDIQELASFYHPKKE